MQGRFPHPGHLRNIVEVGRTTNVANGNGYPTEADEIVCRVWTAVEDGSSRYLVAGDAGTATRGLIFVIRWRGDIAPGMWIRFRYEKHRIEKVEEYDFKRRYLRLITTSAKGAEG